MHRDIVLSLAFGLLIALAITFFILSGPAVEVVAYGLASWTGGVVFSELFLPRRGS